MKPESELIQGIEELTQKEIEKIRQDLARLERERTTAAEKEIAAVRKEIEERVEAQRERIQKTAKAAVATESHRIDLEAKERFFDQVLRAVAARMRELIGNDRYEKILTNWIVEAAVGLASDEAVVTTSVDERELCRRALQKARQRTKELVGHDVKLTTDDTVSSGGQGIVLTAVSGRTAYNNQVRTRMLRRETEIRRIIYEELSRATADTTPDTERRRESRQENG